MHRWVGGWHGAGGAGHPQRVHCVQLHRLRCMAHGAGCAACHHSGAGGAAPGEQDEAGVVQPGIPPVGGRAS